jgi:hypothetical protein
MSEALSHFQHPSLRLSWSPIMNTPISVAQFRRMTNVFFGLAVAWFLAVIIGSETGFFSSLYQPFIGALVAASIILPTVGYFRRTVCGSTSKRSVIDASCCCTCGASRLL